MGVNQASLVVATLLCSLVAGFLFAFAVVVMPGLRRTNDREFIRAFQVIDGVIQDGQPLFLLVWVGSVIALVLSVVLNAGQLQGVARTLMFVALLTYVGGVHVPTVAINIPLNNRLKGLDVDASDEATCALARSSFEARWTRWNAVRTVLACLAAGLLMVTLTLRP